MGNEIPAPTPTPPQEGKRKKYFDYVAGAFGIVGFFLAIYFYVEGKSVRRFTYYVSESRTPIVQKGVFTNLSVSLSGTPITGDVSAVQVQLWNDGKEPIRRDDILTPIQILAASDSPIYQVSLKPLRSEAQATFTNDQRQIMIDWKIMERKKDGISVQIVYGGKIESPFKITGSIVGQDLIFRLKGNKEPASFWNLLSGPGFGIGIGMLLLAGRGFRFRRAKIMLGIFFIILWIVLYLTTFQHTSSSPPFGF